MEKLDTGAFGKCLTAADDFVARVGMCACIRLCDARQVLEKAFAAGMAAGSVIMAKVSPSLSLSRYTRRSFREEYTRKVLKSTEWEAHPACAHRVRSSRI